MSAIRQETDSLGVVEVPADRLWGAQTQWSLEYSSIGRDLMPPERIPAYAVLKKAAANANHAGGRLDAGLRDLIVQVGDEILAGRLVTALTPVIGYDQASRIAHHAMENDLTLRAAALELGCVTGAEFDRIVDPAKMVRPYVAGP